MYQYGSLSIQELSRLVHEKRQRLLGHENYERFGLDFPLAVKCVTVRQSRLFRIGVSTKVSRQMEHDDAGNRRSLWYALDDLPPRNVCQGDVFFLSDDDHGRNQWADSDRLPYTTLQDEGVQLVSGVYFSTAIYDLDDPVTIDYSELDSFVLLTAVQGSAEVADDSGQRMTFREGDTILIPAQTKNIKIEGTVRFLETYV